MRLLRAALLTSLMAISISLKASDEVSDDSIYLDGYVGVGGAVVQHLSSLDNKGIQEQGTREAFRIEFARIRKHISLDARVGFGKDYSDFGGIFRAYKHWRFHGDSGTGLSLGAGLGGMYSQGVAPLGTAKRLSFIDVIGAPFVRFIWDWGNGYGLGFDLEYQLVPTTMYMNDTKADNQDDIKNLRQRVMFGVSFLFEVE